MTTEFFYPYHPSLLDNSSTTSSSELLQSLNAFFSYIFYFISLRINFLSNYIPLLKNISVRMGNVIYTFLIKNSSLDDKYGLLLQKVITSSCFIVCILPFISIAYYLIKIVFKQINFGTDKKTIKKFRLPDKNTTQTYPN